MSLLEVVLKTTTRNIIHFNIRLLLTKICTLLHGNSLSIKVVMDNFLTRSARLHVQNKQSK